MTLRVASHNPPFLPWAGYWHKALSVDVVIYSLGTKLEDNGHDNRVKLHGSWLTVPLLSETRRGPFSTCKFDMSSLPKLARTIRNNFGKKYPYQQRVLEVASALEAYPGTDYLVDLNTAMIDLVARLSGYSEHYKAIRDEVVAEQADSKTERLIKRIRRHFDGPVIYHLGRGALDYIDYKLAAREGIKLVVQELQPSVPDQTILETLATQPDPYAWLCQQGSWSELEAEQS